SEVRFIPYLTQVIRRAVMLIFTPFLALGKTVAARPAAVKKPSRKSPKPRREPVVVTSESGADNAPKTTAARKRKSPAKGQQSLDLGTQSGYFLPSVDLLAPPNKTLSEPAADVLDANSRLLEGVLSEFGVRGEIETARFGPVVTRYELS
ncbi:MAG: DNA translocase FtsK, partial [Alphaproteobacteria bacterium]